MKILIIDDSGVMRRIHKNILIENKIAEQDLLEADNGEDALMVANAEDIDLFLVDWNMPKLDGLVLILLIGVVISIVISVTSQRINLIDARKNNPSVSNQILNPTIRNIMLSGEAPIAVNTMDDLQSIQDFDKIRIYRTDGTIAFNDYATINSVNQYQDIFEFEQTPPGGTADDLREHHNGNGNDHVHQSPA